MKKRKYEDVMSDAEQRLREERYKERARNERLAVWFAAVAIAAAVSVGGVLLVAAWVTRAK